MRVADEFKVYRPQAGQVVTRKNHVRGFLTILRGGAFAAAPDLLPGAVGGTLPYSANVITVCTGKSPTPAAGAGQCDALEPEWEGT